MKVKVSQTEDKELLAEIIKQLDEHNGLCPCALIHDADTKCMCKQFRDMINKGEPGECICGRYIITLVED